jgi:alcohol dehydrogenase class IV
MAIVLQEYVSSWIEEVRPFIDQRHILAIVDPAVEDSFEIIKTLESLQIAKRVTPFLDFSPNPSWESLSNSFAAGQSASVEGVLAIGGGTAIDLAKLTAVALQLQGIDRLWDATKGGIELEGARPNVHLMAIPTTAGTGAEATRFAVLYRDSIKHSISGNALLPDFCGLDPSLLETLPLAVTTNAGLDAACQAMESLWSVKSSPESELDAWAALDLASKHLKPAAQSANIESLTGMLVSAHLAGKAINRTTTTAPHALSYGLTSQLGIPHGRAVAILFGSIFKEIANQKPEVCDHPKGFAFVRSRLEEIAKRWGQTLNKFPDWWTEFIYDELAIPRLQSSFNSELIDHLVTTVNAKRLANSPRSFNENEIREIYREVFPTPS